MKAIRVHDNGEFTEMTVDAIPDVNQELPVAAYLDFDKNDTTVITYAIGTNQYRGIYADSREEARRRCELMYGKIYQEDYVPGRAFFRVRKVKKDL